ncbi:hypothetical protein [Paracidovorax sp. MALMAid1276]|uniref:hypothetical protein n=1 Tax=Paracidovorax sp. MALMAid1276 TaxID=3411631 RepID=UPI003B9B3FCF
MPHPPPAEPAAEPAIDPSGHPPAFDPDSTTAFQARMERAPEWFCSFLAGNSREKSRLKREMATMKGSVVWLVQQRRQGRWDAAEHARTCAM